MDCWEDIDLSEFDCKICHSTNKIVVLACNHKVCEPCLRQIRKQAVRNKNKDALKCPYCRRCIPGAAGGGAEAW